MRRPAARDARELLPHRRSLWCQTPIAPSRAGTTRSSAASIEAGALSARQLLFSRFLLLALLFSAFHFQFLEFLVPAVQRRTSSLIFPASMSATIFWSAHQDHSGCSNVAGRLCSTKKCEIHASAYGTTSANAIHHQRCNAIAATSSVHPVNVPAR